MAAASGEGGAAPLYRYRFGAAEFDEARFELRIAGLAVEAQRKPLEILSLLLALAGEVVTHEELLRRVWLNRPTVPNVIANAMSKLRDALGPEEAARIVTIPRVGYRFEGTVERLAVGRQLASGLALQAGMAVPERDGAILDQLLGRSRHSEVWRAREAGGATRVYKFCLDARWLSELKREATLSRVLQEALPQRRDFVRILGWNFEQPPFFLESEYGGLSLDAWAAAGGLQGLGLGQRFGIFLQIADAVAAAHGVGVLHKDLKPGNVLVEPQGGDWQVRIADFGSGRLLDRDLLDELGITGLGLTMTVRGADADTGTPLYLAPELIAGHGATVRSDVYALGLLLYQLVLGDLQRPLVPGWEREIEDPLLREDIAAATDGDPAYRIPGAAELAARLRGRDARAAERRRLEAAEQAAREARAALARAQARRPWVLTAMAVLLAGLALSLAFYVQSRNAGRRLEQEYRVVETLNRFLAHDLIGAANPARSGRADLTVAQAASSAAAKIDEEFGAEDLDTRAALHAAMQEALSGLTSSEAAIAEGRKALQAYQAQPPPDLGRLIDVRLTLADDLGSLSRFDEMAAMLQQADRDISAAGLDHSARRARYWYEASWLSGNKLSLQQSLEQLKTAWTMAQALPGADEELRQSIALHLADREMTLGDYKGSETLLRDLIARQTRLYGSRDARTAYSMVALGRDLGYLERHDEAIQLLQQAVDGLQASLGADDRRTLQAKNALAGVRFQQDQYAEAAVEWAEVFQSLSRKQGDRNDLANSIRINWAMALQYAGQLPQAEAVYRASLDSARGYVAEDSPRVQGIRYHLADCLLDQGRPREAAPLLAGLDTAALNLSQQAPDWTGRLAYQQGRLALQQGNRAAALSLLRQAEQEIGSKNPDGRISVKLVRQLLAQASRG